MTEKGCENCYYKYFDARAYPCSLCIRGIERQDRWMPSKKTNDEPQTSGLVWTEDAVKNEPKSYTTTTWTNTDESQTESLEYYTDTIHFGKAKDKSITTNKVEDEPQTERPCDTCANKGNHNGECRNCVADSKPIRWETPSHYKPKTEPQTERNIE